MQQLHLAPLAMLLMLSVPHDAAAGAIYSGSVADVVGDSLGESDIVAASIVADDLWITFTMQFAPGTLNPATTRSVFNVDLDQNSATFAPGGSWNGIGVELVVSQNYLGDTGTASLNQFGAGPNASAPVSFLADRVQYSFARSLFGAEDGALDFIAAVQTALSFNSSTPIYDFAPDPRDGPASTSVPEPSTFAMLAGGLSLLSAYRRRGSRRLPRG